MIRWPALLALALGACSPAPQAPSSRPATTIVSLNPCTDAILAEVAEPAQLLAISDYSRDPASSSMDLALARRFPTVRGTVEEVAELRPSLVVTGNFTPPATRTAFARLGLRLEEVPMASTVDASEAQVRRLALLAGHPERGEALVARIEAALADAAPHDAARPTALVWEGGGIVAADDTLIAELLRRAGFAPVAAARGLRQADMLPLERMIADPPQVILATGHPRSGEDRLLSHPALATLKHTRREALDPALLWCGGPTIVRAMVRLKAIRARGTT